MRAHSAHRVENGIVETRLLLCNAQALLIRFHISEIKRIGGSQAGIDQLIARLEQHVDALARSDLEMVLALGANVEIGIQLGLVERLAAARTLYPETFGADSFCARFEDRSRGQARHFPGETRRFHV